MFTVQYSAELINRTNVTIKRSPKFSEVVISEPLRQKSFIS